MVILESSSPQQTRAIGRELSQSWVGPLCVALNGELGTGKTTLVRGLVEGWGGDVSQVSSPTYVLINCYVTPRGPIFHLDAYRIRSSEDLEAVGFSELWDQRGLILVEWAEKVIELLPATSKKISIVAETDSKRRFQIV